MRRKRISWKTKYASALLALDDILYTHATKMTEDHIISLYHIDHNILHETGHPDRNKFWNLTPKLIAEHREKTKQDLKIIAKSRRIRNAAGAGNHEARLGKAPLRTGPDGVNGVNFRRPSIRSSSGPHKIRSRGFDKTRKRKWDGTVVRR
jgi:hypothetical protein